MVRPESNGTVREWFDQLVDLPASEREAALLSLRQQSPELAIRVSELLAHDDSGLHLDPVFSLDEADVAMLSLPGLLNEGAEIETPIGRGRVGRLLSGAEQRAIAEVYRVDLPDQGVCAVKVFRPAVMTDEAWRRFRTESRALASIEHPCVVELLATGNVQQAGLEPLAAIITRYVEGVTLDQWAQGRSAIDIARVIAAVAGGVQYLHEKPILHRDIKPSNIVVDERGRPVLLDLGVAKIVRPHGHPDLSQVASQGTTVAGTLRYMAPEQLTPTTRDVGTRADIYALGVLLYELITGGPMLDLHGLSEAEVFQRKQSARIPAPQGSSARSLVLRVALKAASPDPDQRYGSADRFIEDLERAAEGRAPAVIQAGQAKRLWLLMRRNPLPTAAVVVSTLAILVGAGLYVSAQSDVAEARDQARRQFEVTRKFANWAIFTQSDRLGFLPRSTPIRRDLIDEATQMLDALANDASVDDQFALQIAEGYTRLSEVLRHELGDTTGAFRRLEKAAALLSRPGLGESPVARELRVWVAFRQFDSEDKVDGSPIDLSMLNAMVAELDSIEAALPGDPRLWRWRSEILYYISRGQVEGGESHQPVRQTMDRAVIDADQAAALGPDDPINVAQRAKMRFWRAHAALDTHDPESTALVDDALESALVLKASGHPLGLWTEARARQLRCRDTAARKDHDTFLREAMLAVQAADEAVDDDPTSKAVFRSAESIRIQIAEAALDHNLTDRPDIREAAGAWIRTAGAMFDERIHRGWALKYEIARYPLRYQELLRRLESAQP